jgi:hypothetical protein
MSIDDNEGRRQFLIRTVGAASGLLLSGCDYLSRSEGFVTLLEGAEKLSSAASGHFEDRSGAGVYRR